jgi:hypothetical protein
MKIRSLIASSLLLGATITQASTYQIFSESMGTVTTTTTIATHETNDGFDNDDLSFSGTVDLRATTPSTGYTGASGGANVFFTNIIGREFRIDGISTLGFTSDQLGLSFGAHKNLSASNMTELVVEFSTNGTDWTQLSFPAQPTGTGTATWRLVTISNPELIPISDTLSLRWRQTSSTASLNFRIDDITMIPEPTAVLLGGLGFLGLLRRRR